MNDFIKLRKNDIYLSDSDIKILEKYEINYLNYNNQQYFELKILLKHHSLSWMRETSSLWNIHRL